jgi:hypothetical protein
MAALTELPRGGHRNPVGVLVASSMATDAPGQTMATCPDTTFHCLLTMVIKKLKVRPAHHANRFHTTLTARTRENRPIRNDRQRQNTSQHYQKKQLPNGSHRLFATALLAKAHVNVTRRTNIGTDMASNTAIIICVDVTTSSRSIFVYAKDCILWAENHTIIAFETHATTHATFCLRHGLLFAQIQPALVKIPQYFIASGYSVLALIA